MIARSSAALLLPDPRIDDERAAFKAAMRHLAGGVSVVTVAAGGRLGGLTATSVTSLSAEPPSLLLCIARESSGLVLLRESRRFGVSLLGADHAPIADRFAGRDGRTGAARYEGGNWIGKPGMPPVLADALASFDCEVEETLERYSHTIVIGRVTASRTRGGNGALVYWRAAFGRVGVADVLASESDTTRNPGRMPDLAGIR